MGKQGSRSALRTVPTVVLLSLLLAAGVIGWRHRSALWNVFQRQAELQAWIARFGVWGPAASVALTIAQVILAPIPGQLLGVVNGYLFGLWPGFFYNMLGLFIGSGLAMSTGRLLGRPAVERFVSPQQLARWDRLAYRQGPLFFFLVFLFPFVPDDVACFIIGLSPLSIPTMVVLATLGRFPGVFVSCWIGAYSMELPMWVWIPLGGGSVALAWLFWRYRMAVESLVLRWIRALQRHIS